MNKKELKNAFEKEFKNISVSDKLKEKTLNAVNSLQNKNPSRLPYIRNFAAIFVVTFLCLSIYFSNNFYKKQIITNETINNETVYEPSTPENTSNTLYGGAPIKKSINRENEKSTLKSLPSTNYLYDSSSMQSTDFIENIKEESATIKEANFDSIKTISEEAFLIQYPDAKKIENGYVIYENEKETIYIFKNQVLENIIIID